MDERSIVEDLAERERMLRVITGYRRGEVTRAELPMDAHTYPGRIVEASSSIERRMAEQREYDRQMTEAKAYGYRDLKESLVAISEAEYERLEALRSVTASWRSGAEKNAEALVDQEVLRYPALSQDDWLDAYGRGANKAINEYYFAEKETHQFGRRFENQTHQQVLQQRQEVAVSERHNTHLKTRPEANGREGSESANVVVRELVLMMRNEAARIDHEWHNVWSPNVEGTIAATNHYRGQAWAWNRIREEVLNRHPEAKKDMPQRIDVEQIRVHQNLVIEQELVEHQQAVSTR